MCRHNGYVCGMKKSVATIQNRAGIHCRPTSVILKETREYPGTILISADSGTCDCRSALDILSLGLSKGKELTIEVTGPNEEEFCAHLRELFETNFDFPKQE